MQLGYGNMETVEAWTPQRLTDLLFETGFTTVDRPTTDGGRGVGLDAVRDLTAKMGGLLNVLSNQGQFCEFRLEIPIA